MASVQDRHNINRVALDKWTKREQLCLASAVSCSGDQNWMTVSRSLKLLCGAHHPPDWFSQKLCAVKYGELLENVETPKRKKRTTSDNASIIVETPTDSILRRLTEERIQELKSEIREQQETYAKLYTDVVHLQTGNSNEEQIRAMWMEIEREQEMDRQVKARKQIGTHEIQRNWRQVQFQQQKQQAPISQLQQEQDMEIDETCKPQGTSPLLSSLLKSTSPPSQVGTTMTTSTSRTNAPTITNLLTGGTISSSSVSSSAPSTSQPSGLLAQIPLTTPLFGPAPDESSSVPAQTVLSPSQSAPTLSMLLEKNKIPKESPPLQQDSSSQQTEGEIKTEPTTESNVNSSKVVKDDEDVPMLNERMEEGALTPTKEEEQQLMEVFKNLMPDNIDELADILTSNTGILEEDSILLHSIEGVESLMDEAQDVDDKVEAKLSENETKPDSKNPPPMEEDSGAKIKVEEVAEVDSKEMLSIGKTEETSESEVDIKKEELPTAIIDEKIKSELEVKIETISSDDSSDNVPLAAHAKDAKAASAGGVIIESDESTIPSKQSPMRPDDGDSRSGQENTDSTKNDVTLDDDVDCKNDQSTSAARKASSDSSDVIIIPTDDESNDGKPEQQVKESPEHTDTPNKDEESKSVEPHSHNRIETGTLENPFSQEQTITSICLPDTDDDSSTFEAPIAATISKDEKSNPPKQPPTYKKQESDSRHEEEVKQTLAVRKLRDRDRSESPLVDDDNSDHSITVRSRRRYSSTQVDSIPNSPASSDDREFKVWKKSLMTVYNNLLTNKNATIFLRPFTDEQNPQYNHVCIRPIDLQIIKRHIENGTIRNVTDFQRDVFLMCNNAMMVFKSNSTYANMARDLMHDFVQLKDQIIDAKMEKDKASSSSSPYAHGVKVRGSARKSQRLP